MSFSGLETIDHRPRLVYDGVCNLCVGAVRFLNAIDHSHVMEYTPYQAFDAEATRRYAPNAQELQDRIYIIQRDGSVIRGAAAISQACRLLAPITVICDLFNTPFMERFYDFIARRRYRLFGCRDSCYAPGVKGNRPEIKVF